MARISGGKFITACLVAFIAIAALCPPVAAARRACKIIIVKSGNVAQYNIALEGFGEAMAGANVKCDIVTYSLDGKAKTVAALDRKVREFKPDLILTVGSRATSIVSEKFKGLPIVFSMVLYPVASEFAADLNKPNGNLTGAAIDVPIERQLKMLRSIVPGLKRVGVLYSPEETLPIIEEAVRVAESLGLELLAERVSSASDVDDALKRMDGNKMDALWSVVDTVLFTQANQRIVLDYVVRRRIPFMGPSSGFVRAGALVAMTADERDCGRQAGEIALRILNGDDPGDIPVATPRSVRTALNLYVAGNIRLKIPQSVIDEASEVVK